MRCIALSLLLGAAILIASCQEDDDATDSTPDAAVGQDGSTDSSEAPDQASPVDVASDLAPDAASDAPQDAPADAPVIPDSGPDAPQPDTNGSVDTLPPPKCSVFEDFNCSTTDPFMICHGSCNKGPTNYTIFCHEEDDACYCITGGNTETCPLVDSLCHACENAFATCCTF